MESIPFQWWSRYLAFALLPSFDDEFISGHAWRICNIYVCIKNQTWLRVKRDSRYSQRNTWKEIRCPSRRMAIRERNADSIITEIHNLSLVTFVVLCWVRFLSWEIPSFCRDDVVELLLWFRGRNPFFASMFPTPGVATVSRPETNS